MCLVHRFGFLDSDVRQRGGTFILRSITIFYYTSRAIHFARGLYPFRGPPGGGAMAYFKQLKLFRRNNIEPCTYMLIIRSGEGLYNDTSTREHGASYYYVSNTCKYSNGNTSSTASDFLTKMYANEAELLSRGPSPSSIILLVQSSSPGDYTL